MGGFSYHIRISMMIKKSIKTYFVKWFNWLLFLLKKAKVYFMVEPGMFRIYKILLASQAKNTEVVTAVRAAALDTENIRTAVDDTAKMFIYGNRHCVKSVKIRIFASPYFPLIRTEMTQWEVSRQAAEKLKKWKQRKSQGHLKIIKNYLLRTSKLPNTTTGHPNILQKLRTKQKQIIIFNVHFPRHWSAVFLFHRRRVQKSEKTLITFPGIHSIKIEARHLH